MRLPLQEQRIFLLVLRSKMRLPLQEQRISLLVLRIYHSNSILVYLGGNVNILCRDENVES